MKKIQKVKDTFSGLGKKKIEVDTNASQLNYLKHQIQDVERLIRNAKMDWNYKDVVKYEAKLEKLNNQYNKLISKQNEFSTSSKKTHSEMTKGLGKVTSKIKRFGLSLLSIRSIWSLVSRASSAYLAQDTELTNKLQSVWAGLGAMLAPIIENIVNILAYAVKYINIFIKALTGVDLLARATSKSMNGTAKAAKGLNKALAGFDELNNLDTEAGGGTTGINLAGLKDAELSFSWIDKIKEKWKKFVNFLEKTDWQKLGKNFYNAIKTWFLNIDWGKISDSIFEGIGAIYGAFYGFIAGILTGVWKDIKSYFSTWIEKSKQAGGNIVEGILLGILNAVYQIGKWIYDHIFTPFINGFKKAFGIASPSTVMEEMGHYIIEGFFEGLKNVWDVVKGIFERLITNIIKKTEEIINGVKNVLGTVAQWIYDNVIEPVANFFNGLWEGIKTKFQEVWNFVITAFSRGGEIFNGLKDGIVNVFKTIVNALITGINKIISVPFNVINGVLNTIRDITIPVINVQPFTGLWGYNPLPVPQIPQLAVGTNYVPEDQLAYIHKGEAVVPKKFNSDTYFNRGNEETNSLLRQVIDAVNNIEINPYTTVRDVGKASLSYINSKSRQLGTSVLH